MTTDRIGGTARTDEDQPARHELSGSTGKLGSASRPADAARLSLNFRSGRERPRLLAFDQRHRLAQHVDAGTRLDAILGKTAAKRPRSRNRVKRADEVTRDRMQPDAAGEFAFDVGQHRLEHVLHGRMRWLLAEQLAIDRKQSPWFLIGGASQHHAVDAVEMALRLLQTRDAAI